MAIHIHWEQWQNLGKNPCINCRALNGKLFRKGEGPIPGRDTHHGCMCQRFYHHTEIIEDDEPEAPFIPPIIIIVEDEDEEEEDE